MHGPRGGKGGEEEERAPSWHMWPVPLPGAAVAVSPRERSDSPKNFTDSFVKDGRKIHIGDCALFQAGNAPPFIGIIRWCETGKENYPKLGVNWLYRPADLKLPKGSLLEAAPNEVFYSFHKDVIPVASLLHPCKVAFLRRGVELPAGIFSFVCRRVYDIANKCLWWLTDQDYINERQEEVDQLLDKAQEMHASVQSGGRSPKPLNGPTSTQQLKSGSDSIQNSGTSFPSQVKRKRERGEQGGELIKRERFTKTEDGDSGNSKYDSMIKAEIANLTEKGGLVNNEGVEKLVHIIQLDKAERRIDLAGRKLLADLIAATERFDCLGRFVQLRGVPVLDDWIQEAHKGKAGDGSSPKENDKAIDELLLTLLRALDKLPVNLNALQTCNIGKSVNNLRSHKNVEVQRKARSLVDTWKKRVDAEMAKTNDAKSVGSIQAASWPVKQGLSETSHAGNRRFGSVEVTTKNPITLQSTCKSLAGKLGGVDAPLKPTAVTPGSSTAPSPLPMAVGTNSKDSCHKASGGSGTSELPLAAVKEEKSSNSSQSQNNSQSCSSDHVKSMGSSWKEDARSSTAGSRSASKSSGGSSRHRRSSNGSHGSNTSGIRKENNIAKSVSVNRAVTSGKASESGLTCDRLLDTPSADQVNGHRLIVKLPNPGRSPAQSTSGGSFGDPSIVGSRVSSPGFPDKNDNSERENRTKSDAFRAHLPADVNAESWQSNDVKEGPVGSDEVEKDEDRSRNADIAGKKMDVSRAACTSSGMEKEVILGEHNTRDSFSSMNALIESCSKYSELSAPLTAGDDTGMNLLASVAAGEMAQSDLALPSASSQKTPSIVDNPCPTTNEAKSGSLCDDSTAENHVKSEKIADVFEKNEISVLSSIGQDELQRPITILGDNKATAPLEDCKVLTSVRNEQYSVSSAHFHKNGATTTICEGGREEGNVDRCLSLTTASEMKELDGATCYQLQDKPKDNVHTFDSSVDSKLKVRSPLLKEKESTECIRETNDNSNFCALEGVCSSYSSCRNENACTVQKLEKLELGESPSCPTADMNVQKLKATDEVPEQTALSEDLQPIAVQKPAESADKRANVAFISSGGDKTVDPVGVDEPVMANSHSLEVKCHLDSSGGEILEQDDVTASRIEEHAGSAIIQPVNMVEEIPESKGCPEKFSSLRASHDPSPAAPASETEQSAKSSGSRLSGSDADGRDEPVSCTEASTLAIASGLHVASKRDFDLNEGISGNDVNQGEAVGLAAPVFSSSTHVPIPSPFASSSMPNGLPVPIMVAFPAKGPFVPPENPLQNKGELRWKGSAATSAFRPAEPRRVFDMPLSAPDIVSQHPLEAKPSRPPLDIDLNVADDRVLEDLAYQSSAQTTCSNLGIIRTRDAPVCAPGGLDLDLNRVDGPTDNGRSLSASTSCRLDVSLFPVRPVTGGLSNGDSNSLRDFDLNNGPGLDELLPEPFWSQQAKLSNLPVLSPIASSKANSAEVGNVSSWFPPNGSYPAVPMPTFLPDRREQPYPIVAASGAQGILGPVNGSAIFGGDFYRGQVLSSSPAMAFSPAAAFPYAGFPFGSSFPLASTSFSGGSTMYIDSSSGRASTFPTVPSQLASPRAGVSAHYPRPYVISLPEGGTNSGSEGSSKWSRQGFDLNTGPGNDMEGKDDRFSLASRPFIVGSSQASVEEQARLYNVAGGVLKRKEPEGGWDADRFAYKQPPWQ